MKNNTQPALKERIEKALDDFTKGRASMHVPPLDTDVDMVLAECSERLSELEARCAALAAENAYLLNGAARELNTSWMFHKTMLGAQAALVCLSHGYQAAAREWLEGTTDEAGAEIPDDISVGELHEWFESNMVSNDGKSGFLTRGEAEVKIRAECPATDAFLAEVRAQGVDVAIEHLINKFEGTGRIGVPVMALEWLAQELRKGVQS